jgi:hypothetical protein
MSRLEQRLDETLAPLRAAGIDVLLLKGAALASTIYPTFNARPMGDLDLLVRGGRDKEAWELVRGVRWSWDHQENLDRFYEEHHHYPPLHDADGTELRLELHTALFVAGHPFNLPLTSLWDTAEPVPVRGAGIYVLEHHAQMLHLCLHFAWSHTMASASWRTCRDLQTLIGTGRTDWDRFIELAHGSRAATSTYWTFRLARALSGLEVPPEVLDRLAPPGAKVMLRLLERHYLAHLTPAAVTCPSPRMERAIWELGVRPRWSGHGESRPWNHDSLFVEPATTAEDTETDTEAAGESGIGVNLWERISRLPDWLGYLGVLTGSSARAARRAAANRPAISSSRARSA